MEKIEQLKETIYPIFWDSGSYSFLSLEIKLNQTASLKALLQEKEEASCFVTLVHEFIHYIQNFTTTWGFTNFITYVDLFAIFFGDNILLESNPSLPLLNGIVDKKFRNKNYLNYLKSAFLGIQKDNEGNFIFTDTDKNNFEIIESTLIDPYWEKEIYIAYISYNGKLIPLNELVLSENMAIVGSYLSSGLSVEDSKKTIDQIWGAQYHIVYSFLNNLFPAKNTLKLTYFICESSLLIVPYNKTISKILIYIKTNLDSFASLNEEEIIDKILHLIDFENSLNKLVPAMLEQLESRIATLSKYKENYEFYKYLLVVLEIFKNGFKERLTIRHTYKDEFTSSFLNSFADKIYSPILVFADKQKTMLGNPETDFVNSIAYFNGVLKVFHHAYFKEICKCPFAEEYSICTVEKGIECQTSCLDVYNKEKYKGCLMNNALNIIGIRKNGRK